MPYDFKKAAGVKLSERGEYLSPVKTPIIDPATGRQALDDKGKPAFQETPGEYLLKVKRVIVKHSRKDKDLWISEFEVVESNNPEHPAGKARNWVQDLSDPEVGFRSVKGFLYAASGLDAKDAEHKKIIDECEADEEEAEVNGKKVTIKKDPRIITMMNEALEDPSDPACKNSLEGALVRCEVRTIITKGKGQPFSRHDFFPYTPPAKAA